MKNSDANRLDRIENILSKLIGSNDFERKFNTESTEKDKNEKPKQEKKKNIDIPKEIRKACKENEDIFILSMDNDFAFLLKRKEEVVTKILGEGTMNPVEQQKNVVYFDCFSLWWKKSKKDKPKPRLVNLSEYGFPIYEVETEYDINKFISEF